MKVGAARVMSCLALALAATLPLTATSAPRGVSPQIALGPKAQPAGQASPPSGEAKPAAGESKPAGSG